MPLAAVASRQPCTVLAQKLKQSRGWHRDALTESLRLPFGSQDSVTYRSPRLPSAVPFADFTDAIDEASYTVVFYAYLRSELYSPSTLVFENSAGRRESRALEAQASLLRCSARTLVHPLDM